MAKADGREGLDEHLAIMREVNVGMRDWHRPVLWFTVDLGDGRASLQVLEWEQAGAVISEAGCYGLEGLQGRPCYVTLKDNLVRFVRPWKGSFK